MHARIENHLKKMNLSQEANLQGISSQTLWHAVQRVIDLIRQLLLSAMRQLKSLLIPSARHPFLMQMLSLQDATSQLESLQLKYKEQAPLGFKQL